MGLLLFLLTAGALAIITAPLLKKDKYTLWTVGAIFISSIIIASNGIYRACQDAWPSHNIGKQGACSWHRGVVTRLSDFGWIVLVVLLVIIIGAYIYVSYREKKKQKNTEKMINLKI